MVHCTKRTGAAIVLGQCWDSAPSQQIGVKGGPFYKKPAFEQHLRWIAASLGVPARRYAWVSPCITKDQFRNHFCRRYSLFRTWEEAVSGLRLDAAAPLKVAVFPCAPLHRMA